MNRRRIAALGVAAATPLVVAASAVWALGGVEGREADVPAAVVNADEMLTTTAPDGSEQIMFAGRQLVTDLTGDATDGFDWRIVNAEDAEELLDRGDVHAVVTIPGDFSERVMSLQGDEPQQAGIRIETDAAHDGISTRLATEVGESLVGSFGDVVTSGFVSGIYGGMGQLAEQLGQAVDGARQLGDGNDALAAGLGDAAIGATQLGDGAGEAAAGAGQLEAGAGELANGAGRLAGGIDGVAGGARQLADGLQQADAGIGQLSSGAASVRDGVAQYSQGVDAYTAGVQQAVGQAQQALASADQAVGGIQQLEGSIDQAAQGAAGLVALLEAAPDTDPAALETARQLAAGLQRAAAADASGQLASGFGQLGTGLAQLDRGAAQLQAGGAPLRDGSAQLAAGLAQLDGQFGQSVSGARALADGAAQLGSGAAQLQAGAAQLGDGIGQLAGGLAQLEPGADALAAGIRDAQSGATQLGDGASELADGLAEGIAQMPRLSDAELENLSSVVADPVGFELTERGAATGEGRVASLAVPLALWLGALATALALWPRRRAVLASTASDGRVLGTLLARGGWVLGLQVVLATLVVHGIGQAPWSLVGQTLAVAVPFALGATLLHIGLVALWPRMGAVVSTVLLAVQGVAAGGLLPRTMLGEPFRALGEWLPVTHATDALLSIAAGRGDVWGPLALTVLFALAMALVALLAIRRARRTAAQQRLAALAPA